MYMGSRIMGTTLKLVLVIWHDAVEMEAGWHSIEDIRKHNITVCKSVGWLVSKDTERIVIMSTIEGNETDLTGGGVHSIPTDWCISIKPLSTYTSPHYKME
jgi:hypothetical protein